MGEIAMRNTKRNPNGTFKRTINLWTPDNWDDGWLEHKGRFMVYRPDCPRAYKGGYALRYHVVWWLAHGEAHPREKDLHHIDGTKDNDHLENLQLCTHSEHRIIHDQKLTTVVCRHCGKSVERKTWRVLRNNQKFCSRHCAQTHPQSDEHRQAISRGLKEAYKKGRR